MRLLVSKWNAPAGPRGRAAGPRRATWLLLLMLLADFVTATPVRAAVGPYIWDQDNNGKDDRIESVNLLGWSASFAYGDTLGRQRIQVDRTPTGFLYGVYVLWDHVPTPADLLALNGIGMPVLARIQAIPATRSVATFAQVNAAAALPGVIRIEAVPLLYVQLREGAAAVGVRDQTLSNFPTWPGDAVSGGAGVNVALLDTGVNDAAEGGYPGQESIRGIVVGGASFLGPDSTSHTAAAGSENPSDHGGSVTHSHGTYIASVIAGRGSDGGFAVGMAPQAKLIDVKVLDDTGRGVALPEALDWCITNRDRDWGGGARGIQVINLSLSSPDASDGQDLASRLAARAVESGIVVVASMGNDGLAGHVPSPAAGDGVIAVGAWDTHRTVDPADDSWPAFQNTGPRASDGDADGLDECKPDVLAPGVDVLAADGDVTSDGTHWQRLSGTSVATAFVSGAAALLRAAEPTLTPVVLAERLRATAQRPLPAAPAGVAGADPRWSSSRGCGLLDVYSASLERSQSSVTQVRRFALAGAGWTISATFWTQREYDTHKLFFERAADVSGAPGLYSAIDSVTAVGDSSIAAGTARPAYSRSWPVPIPEAGKTFWYRISWLETGVWQHAAERSFTSPGGPDAATLEITLVHNAIDSDIDAFVQAGANGPRFTVPGTRGAVASDRVSGASATGNESWTLRTAVPVGAADAWLPPAANHRWSLEVHDGGRLDRSGRVVGFRLIWHGPSGDQAFDASPVPVPTLEGRSVQLLIPAATLDVEGAPAPARLMVLANPAVRGSHVNLRSGAPGASSVRIYDLAGREVRRVILAPDAGGAGGTWDSRDARGAIVPPGVYLARANAGGSVRIVLLAR